MFFRGHKTEEPPDYPVARCLEIMERGDYDAVGTLYRMYFALNCLRSKLHLPSDTTFAELKASLRPDQAAKAADKARQLGFVVAREKPDDAVSEMVLILIAATLHSRAGARWIDAKQAALIDHLIATAEQVVRR